ncbi:MAG: dihydroorotase [Alphaproteobacteria bacterium]
MSNSETFDLILKGGTVATPSGIGEIDVGVRAGKIAAIADLDAAQADEVYDAKGLHVLPGVIDTQVHFREPGLEHKEDLESGGRAAVAGGVTAVFEMPNTNPSTTTVEALADKVARGRNRMPCDFAFFAGATAENVTELPKLERLEGVCGVKLFMGSSTGTLLVADDDTVREVMRNGRRRMSIHAEDEDRLIEREPITRSGNVADHSNWRDVETAAKATRRVLKLAREVGRRVHVLHVTTADEVPLLAAAKDVSTMEVTPQHLTLSAPDCYERLGSYAQMNPPIREAHHQAALWQAVRDGVVDVIGSDHAPHTKEEKARDYPGSPSGMPGVQTLVPLMLTHVAEGRLTLERFVDLTAHGANRIFGIAGKGRLAIGYDADFTVVDLKAKRTITTDWIESRCGWTPFEGFEAKGWPMATIVRGHFAMRDGEITDQAAGQPVRFQETI